MAIFKNKDIATDIRVTDVNVGNIGAKFYSEDENTASIGIYIKNNGQVLDLSTITMKPMLNLYAEDGSVFLDEPLTVVSATEGFIKYYVSPEIVKHVGRMNAKLFLESPTDSVHVANFSFDIGDSGTEKDVAKVIDIDILGDKILEIMTVNAHLFKGESLKYEDLTDEQKAEIKGSIVDLSSYAKVGASYTKSESDSKYALKGETSTGTVDMTGYDKTATLDTKYAPISHTHSEYLTKTQGDGYYAPKTHTHTASDIGTYTKTEIDNKITTAQTGGTVDLSAYLKSADASITYAPKAHTHTIGDISNLQVTLDGKALASHNHDTVYSKLGHIHAISDITNLQTTLNGKASTTHNHAISDVTNLQNTLDGKAPTSHTHTTSQITDFSTEMSKKANTAHSHAIGDVTNLQTVLDGKASTSHTHTASQVLMSDGTTVQDKINSLPTSGGSSGSVSAPAWINATLSNGFTGTVKYCKDGFNIVTVNVDITVGSSTGLNTVVASLPQGYLPPMAYLPDLFYNSSVGQADAFFNVGNVFNGVTVAKGLQQGHNIRGQFMFRV
ncbi:BppU family phage baseplate upper protein [Macrococcoides goetzii]|uniref:BppU family phage baseplate upper protein n=1 Tax=Macrococcus sp. PK TaxID=2801919 RepID=UPI001F11805A|nr:BppU family phage baseplate upper protein [Macrococcus sp. PK]MCH4984228.1 BppU family phage baseplate upper protein [Macrococcus sp. PK]